MLSKQADNFVHDLSRGCRQREARRSKADKMAQECCEALRWMSSGVRGTKAGIQDDPLYGEVHERARELAAERIRDGIIFSPEEAARQLLRARPGYEADAEAIGCLASYKPGKVSLPSSNFGAPMASSLLDDSCRATLVDFEKHMLRDAAEMEAVSDLPPVQLYHDPVLGSSPRVWGNFCKDLHKRGLLTYGLTKRGSCTVFFVSKRGELLRMILDCREVNRMFKSPPGVQMASPDAFANLEVPECDPESLAFTKEKSNSSCSPLHQPHCRLLSPIAYREGLV